jgi:hypothetical protein
MDNNTKMNIINELNIQKKNLELLNLLETRCEGLENLLCKNVINIISKKIDSIEKRFSYEYGSRVEKGQEIKIQETANIVDDKISVLNNNINLIEKGFKNIASNPDSNTTDIISKKIEENYKLLDELERTNAPIFSKTTDFNNRMYIEDKLKEMDDKLGVLFSVNNPKAIEYRKKEDSNDFSRDISFNKDEQIDNDAPTDFIKKANIINPADEKINRENEIKKKKEELYNKLNETEKKIKNIAGRILKNF